MLSFKTTNRNNTLNQLIEVICNANLSEVIESCKLIKLL